MGKKGIGVGEADGTLAVYAIRRDSRNPFGLGGKTSLDPCPF